jgi:hypothetical protein
MNRNPVVISLCDLTGNFTQPWQDAGYDVVLVDPQHGHNSVEGTTSGGHITRLALTVEDAMPILGAYLRTREIAFVAGWPVCTDMAVSGARWFESKRAADPHFQGRAFMLAEQCRTFARLSGAPYLIENPVSVLSAVFGKPDHTFHPADFTAFEPADNYTKKTCLWTGNGFVMPAPARDESLGEPDNRIHFASPGPERANFRSATPMGFARAVFYANADARAFVEAS